jgi:hypothetical protein
MDDVRKIADAVLYEGYLLWPYTRSALKNQRRWTFGGVYPPALSAEHPDDPCVLRAQCLLEGSLTVDVRVRFLHVVRRQVLRDGAPVDALEAGGTRWLSWDEAVERELTPGDFDLPACSSTEQLGAGVEIRRSWRALRGRISVSSEEVARDVRRVTVEIANHTPFAGSREEALLQTLCSTHAVLRGGPFVSLADPPEHLRAAARTCANDGLWPVLVGPPGSRDTVLASPIILEDHPRVAPESPGDLFDGGEVDELLVLNILSLTDEEKAEMRDSDPRAGQILERTESLTDEQLMRLHGARR